MKESRESKMVKDFVLYLFQGKEEGKIVPITKGRVLAYVEEDPEFAAIWAEILRGEKKPRYVDQGVNAIRTLCNQQGNGKEERPTPPRPPPRGLTDTQKEQLAFSH